MIFAAPVAHTFELKTAHALDIVKDLDNIRTNILQTIAAQSLEQKELVLDRIFYNLAQKTLQKMTGDILNFINTGGPNGEPMFITDFSDYMQEINDEVAQEFIYGDQLDSVCEPFEINIRIALATNYQLGQKGGLQKRLACTIDKNGIDLNAFYKGTFSASTGNWSSHWSNFFETILNPQQTLLGGYIEAEGELETQANTARWEALMEQKDGMKPVKACTGSGTTGKCDIRTPASAILAQMEDALGAPMQSILNADEFDEIIGSLFGNLANQALSGANGLLGLNDKIYGTGGNQNYFDAIKNDPTNNVSNGQNSTNPIIAALVIETRVGIAQVGIVNAIQDITRCSPNTVLPAQLQTIVSDFTPKVVATGRTVTILENMAQQYASSTSQIQQQALLTQLETMRINGSLEGLAKAIEYEQFLRDDLTTYITQFKLSTGYVSVSCSPTSTP
jgi:hypothetical protein